MKKIIAGNWKMHGDMAMAQPLTRAVAQAAQAALGVRVVVCPPSVLLWQVGQMLEGSGVSLGGQDCHGDASGAHTGDISASMLKEAGCGYVIVGHSERRAAYGETGEAVRRKAASALAAGLIPILCIGETDAQRSAGQAGEVVAKQVAESLPVEAGEGNFVLAYEPVWAIGSGKTPDVADISRMHALVRSAAAQKTGLSAPQVSVLYGGSVNAANADDILSAEGVSGTLVGGASLKAEEFCKIIQSCHRALVAGAGKN